MEQLKQSLQSYLNLRAALLRQVTSLMGSGTDCYAAIGLTPSSQRRRKLDPASWQFDELAQVAHVAGLSSRVIDQIQLDLLQLKPYLATLSTAERQRFYGYCQLNGRKLALRHKNPQLWQGADLDRMAAYLTMRPESFSCTEKPQIVVAESRQSERHTLTGRA